MSFSPYNCTKHPRPRGRTRNGQAGVVDLAVERGAPKMFYVNCPTCGHLTVSRHINELVSDGWEISPDVRITEGITLRAVCPRCRTDLPAPVVYRCKCCHERRVSYSSEALKRMGWTIIGDLVYCPEHTKSHKVSLAALAAKATEIQMGVKP